MGIETIAFAALTGLSAIQSINQSKKEAAATVREGELATKEKAKEVRYKAARQTVSFLNSGLTLEGTPNAVIGETYSTGLEDINNIRSNYNTKSKNIISAGRTEAIGKIASGFGNFAMGGGGGSMFGSTMSQPAFGAGTSTYFGNTGWVDWNK